MSRLKGADLGLGSGADTTALHSRGSWASGLTYLAQDIVSRSGSLYRALVATPVAKDPALAPTYVDPNLPVVSYTFNNLSTYFGVPKVAHNFTPSINITVGSVDILFRANGGGRTVTVGISAAAPSGTTDPTLIASVSGVAYPTAAALARFTFTTPVALQAGVTYYLVVIPSAGSDSYVAAASGTHTDVNGTITQGIYYRDGGGWLQDTSNSFQQFILNPSGVLPYWESFAGTGTGNGNLNYKGAYSTGTSYATNDVVLNAGLLYRAKQAVSPVAVAPALSSHAEFALPASTTSYSVTLPSGIGAGDLIIAAMVSNTPVYTFPAGWTKVTASAAGGGTFTTLASYWTKIAVAGDAGSTVAITANTTEGQAHGLIVRSYSQAVLDVQASAGSLSTPVITPTSYPATIISAFFAVASPSGVLTLPTTGVANGYSAAPNNYADGAVDEALLSGPSISRTATATNAGYVSVAIALTAPPVAFNTNQFELLVPASDSTALHNKGAWSSTVAYAANDVVSRQYALYAALSSSTGTDPAAGGSGATPTIVQKAPLVTSNPTFATPSAVGNSVLLVVQGSGTGTPTVPSGFTLLYDTGVDPNTGGRVLYFLRNDGVSVTSVTYAGSNPGVSSVNFMGLFELSGICSSVGTGLSPSINSGTTTLSITSSGPWLAFLTGVNGNGGQSPAPSGFTEQYSKNAGQYEYLWTGSGSGNLQVTATAGSTFLFLSAVLLVTTSASPWQKIANASAQKPVTVANTGAAYTVPDVDTAAIHHLTLTANCTFTFPTYGTGKSFTIELIQDATGSRTATWPSSVRWVGGLAPVLSTAAGAADVVSFVSGAGSTWIGSVSGPPVSARTTTAATTASIASGASLTTTIQITPGYRLYRLSTSRIARVRLYDTVAHRDADVGRAIGVDPGPDTGVMLDYVTSATSTVVLSPLPMGFDGKATPDGVIPMTVDNRDSVAGTVTVTLTYVRTE